MLYYAIQVTSQKEDSFVHYIEATQKEREGRFIIPKKSVEIYKAGKTTRKIRPVFPGYVFYETPELTNDMLWFIRRSPNFFRFLPESKNAMPLTGDDKNLLLYFISFGKQLDISSVSFDEDDRIVVIDGALKGLVGKIVRVDKRKRKAKVMLEMLGNSFSIYLGFSVVERVPTSV